MSPQSIFRTLHRPGNPFIMANAWDLGSAKLLAALGAPALATSSGAHAFTLGKVDGGLVSRDQAIRHAAEMAAATGLPVSADLENGYGPRPEDVALTVRLAGEAGLAGCCIEDTVLSEDKAYDFSLAVERIAAGAEAARALDQDFVLCARADGVLIKTYDFAEALRRLQAFEAVGADCLYAPMLDSLEDVRQLCSETTAPVNVLASGPYSRYSRDQYAEIGVARISLGAALAGLTHTTILTAGQAMFEDGDFSSLSRATAKKEINRYLNNEV